MTDTTASTHPGTLRVERDLQRAIHHTEAGRVAVPILISSTDGAPATGAEMILPGDDAENMCDEIDMLLRGRAAGPAPRARREASSRSRRASLQDTAFDTPGA